jgi:two-component system response regulator AtoC
VEYRALIVDDEETYAKSIERLLGRRGIAAERAATSAEAITKARRRAYDLVVLDYLLPDGTGLDLIAPLRALRPSPQVLMMTAFGTIENAVEAMRRGAHDYVTKSTAIEGIVERVVDMRRVAEARREVDTDGAIPSADLGPSLLGESPGMREARARLEDVARSPDTTVLLTGESGTGKGVAARLVHARSSRVAEPYAVIDCVSLPPTLAESELFGHEKGAFTGAERGKPGKLEAVGRGTVLLDEIGDMELSLQGKLLRVLEERTFERVGGLKPIAMGARVIAATHRDLSTLVEERRFRLDLYHRLMVFPIHLPALRERGDDVVLLAEHFARHFGQLLARPAAAISAPVADALRRYDFPGNVRELKNVVERAVILAPAGAIAVEHLPDRVVAPRAASAMAATLRPGEDGVLHLAFRAGVDTLEGVERRLVEEAMRMASGKKARAAELLGISRYALMRRLEKLRD